jgi:hypothetical protein
MKQPPAFWAIVVRPFGFIHHKVGSAKGAFDVLIHRGRSPGDSKSGAPDHPNYPADDRANGIVKLPAKSGTKKSSEKSPEQCCNLQILGLEFLGSAPWADIPDELDLPTAVKA